MSPRAVLLSLTLVLPFASLACSSAEQASPLPRTIEPDTTAVCTEGESRCEGDAIATCSGGAFGAPVACDGDAICKAGACVEPTAEQRAQAAELASMLGFLEETTAWHGPIDWAGLERDGRLAIFRGDGGAQDYFAALFRAFVRVPQGHQGLYLARGCGKTVPSIGYASRCACGRPHPRGVVVTYARAGNPLGVSAGDLVVRVGETGGRAVLDELADRPACVTSRPSASYRDASVAATFADLVRAGEVLEIESPGGERREVTVPAGAPPSTLGVSCADPLGRDTSVPVESYVRPDGVGVIRLPGFTDPEQTFPSTGADIEAYRAKFVAKIQAAFDAVKSAPAIVWDVRGNGGGLTLVGLEIASGFPGAQGGEVSYCQARVVGSEPPAFDPLRYAQYALTPGGAFAYAGKVAVLIDGLDYSAADYFPLVAKAKTSARLVGAATAGGFGATSDTKQFDGPPSFAVSTDRNRCALVCS